MKIKNLPYMSLLAFVSATGCSATVDSTEGLTRGVAEAITASGVTASVANVSVSGQTYTATVTVSNQSQEPTTNWQVGINFHTGSFITGQLTGADANVVGGVLIFTAPLQSAAIAPGNSYSFKFNGRATGSNYTPTVATVDGMAPGTVNAGNPADGVDPIARSAATAALGVAYHYVQDKLDNSPRDLNYYMYTDLIWDSHSYRIASDNKTIEFDPNVPGYRFIPNSAKAELAFAQLDPSVASYLSTGLASCFAQVNYDLVYAFTADFLSNVSFPGGGSGSRMNADRTVDNYVTTIVPAKGTMELKITETSTTDENFGIITYLYERHYATSQDAIIAKYANGDCGASSSVSAMSSDAKCAGQEVGCSPFNGPGGSSNPYLVMSINGSQIPARFNLQTPADCSHGCTSTAVVDPVPYAEPGAYYDTNSNLVGPQPNPFGLLNTNLYADPNHQSQWATRTVNGTQEWGTFTKPAVMFGLTKYMYVKQM